MAGGRSSLATYLGNGPVRLSGKGRRHPRRHCGQPLTSHTAGVAIHNYTREAEALFARFAERHGLTYQVETGVPMEVCWTFPEQEKLFLPVTLGLQNGDELNFGVSDFWSYFFPFEKVAEKFEHILDAWVAGDARIAITGRRSRLLQLRQGDQWQPAYGANGCLFPFGLWLPPRGFVYNGPSG